MPDDCTELTSPTTCKWIVLLKVCCSIVLFSDKIIEMLLQEVKETYFDLRLLTNFCLFCGILTVKVLKVVLIKVSNGSNQKLFVVCDTYS